MISLRSCGYLASRRKISRKAASSPVVVVFLQAPTNWWVQIAETNPITRITKTTERRSILLLGDALRLSTWSFRCQNNQLLQLRSISTESILFIWLSSSIRWHLCRCFHMQIAFITFRNHQLRDRITHDNQYTANQVNQSNSIGKPRWESHLGDRQVRSSFRLLAVFAFVSGRNNIWNIIISWLANEASKRMPASQLVWTWLLLPVAR